MSVTNQADEKLAQAKQSVRHALKQLNDIVILECEGHSDFSESYLEKITEAHTMLIEVRRKLG